jgi:hypothetical protein
VARIGILTVCLFVILIVIQIVQSRAEGISLKLLDLLGTIIQTILIGLVTALLIINESNGRVR